MLYYSFIPKIVFCDITAYKLISLFVVFFCAWNASELQSINTLECFPVTLNCVLLPSIQTVSEVNISDLISEYYPSDTKSS